MTGKLCAGVYIHSLSVLICLDLTLGTPCCGVRGSNNLTVNMSAES
jgi:hypothetical protein